MTDEVVLTDADVSEEQWLQAIGRVVVATSGAEHELGELLLTIRSKDLAPVDKRAAGQTGSPLVEALVRVEKVHDGIGALASQYEGLLDRRNNLVHGAWVLSVFEEFPTISAKRDRKDPSADLSGFIWRISDLVEMSNSFEMLRLGARKILDELNGLPRPWSELDGG